MFLGTYTPRLDDKGRLILPAKYRDRLADGLVVTRGQERCLYIFPMDEFVRIAEAARNTPLTRFPTNRDGSSSPRGCGHMPGSPATAR